MYSLTMLMVVTNWTHPGVRGLLRLKAMWNRHQEVGESGDPGHKLDFTRLKGDPLRFITNPSG